ncbi:MAG: hypothetical protein JWM85_3577, partial [Acidimicrobiaceae bacterium]|nr:hypothetical protein [Acidimicrobiaceae bacterium]
MLSVALAVAGLLVVAVVVASFVSVPYYALTPGQGIDVANLISVPARVDHAHRGRVLLTDVNLVPLRAIDYLFYRWNSDDQVVPSGELVGTATSAQYNEQGAIDMDNARQAATVVALSRLGYPVRAVPSGVIVYQPLPGSPAAAHLAVGDVVTAIGGTPTLTLVSLQRALATQRPGTVVVLSLDRVASSSHRSVDVRLGRVGNGGATCLPVSASKTKGSATAQACLGIETAPAYRTVGLPFKVTIDSEGIIGPSAGLAFTLGLLDALDRGDLTAGRRIAATGTMSVTGQVGDVGGVAQKTVAVRNAGAKVFFVPPQELAVARAHAGSTLKVEAVSTI